MSSLFDQLVEERIRQAMEEGKFENLAGKGQPLQLEENPFEDPEWRAAHRLLRGNNLSLPWIEARQEIEAQADIARRRLQQTWEVRQAQREAGQPAQAIDEAWKQDLASFAEQVAAINRRILSYNLQAPNPRFHLAPLDAAGEVAQVGWRGPVDRAAPL